MYEDYKHRKFKHKEVHIKRLKDTAHRMWGRDNYRFDESTFKNLENGNTYYVITCYGAGMLRTTITHIRRSGARRLMLMFLENLLAA